MSELCHRCHGELPARASEGRSSGRMASAGPGMEPDAMLFCPHCSAPQIRLPEHMQVLPGGSSGGAAGAGETTGSVPPPHPRDVDWPVALRSAAGVALGGALLTVAGFEAPFASLLATVWVIGCSVITLGLYAKQRPGAWMDTRTGMRIGFATGVLMVAALGVAAAVAGVVARYGLHGMHSLDAQMAEQFGVMQTQMTARMQEQQQGVETQQRILGFMNSAEVRGGLALVYLGVLGCFVLLFATAGGAFAGLLRDRRHGVPQG